MSFLISRGDIRPTHCCVGLKKNCGKVPNLKWAARKIEQIYFPSLGHGSFLQKPISRTKYEVRCWRRTGIWSCRAGGKKKKKPGEKKKKSPTRFFFLSWLIRKQKDNSLIYQYSSSFPLQMQGTWKSLNWNKVRSGLSLVGKFFHSPFL